MWVTLKMYTVFYNNPIIDQSMCSDHSGNSLQMRNKFEKSCNV